MSTSLRTERDVESNLLGPLFRDVLGYPSANLEWGKSVQLTFGRETKTKEADLVVSCDNSPVITVEAKRPTEPVQSGLNQVDSYAFALKTPYSIVTNGRQFVLRGYYSFNSRINVIDESVDVLSKKNWGQLAKIISFKNVMSSISQPESPVTAPDEEQIKDYRRFFRRLHNVIRDREKLDPAAAFDELSKLLFLKAAEDEWQSPGKVLTPKKIDEWNATGKGNDFIDTWFQSAVNILFPGVFEDQPRINLSVDTLKDLLQMMKPFHVKSGDVDVKGRAFEEFLPSQLRGEGLGQFFTPRPIVNFMADLADISIRDIVVDFSCGSGGFLIKAFEMMKARVEQLPPGIVKRMGLTKKQLLEHIKSDQVHGIDAEPRAAKTARMNMLMWGDGKRVVRGNGLSTKARNGKPYEPREYNASQPHSGCTLILANPPFGSKEKDQSILRRYEMGSKLAATTVQKTEILFLEKGLKLLQPEGRMLIVLPQGLLSGVKYDRVRDFIHSRAEIRAIVSLPTHTFVQSGVPTVNTCILYVQKFTEEKAALFKEKSSGLTVPEIREMLRTDNDFDYSMFMGTSEFVGYEPSGRSIVAKEELTDLDLLLDDFNNQAVLAHPDIDLFEFATTHYGDKSHKRKEQTVRGSVRGLKTSFVISLSETEDRLDPPFYLFRSRAQQLLDTLTPLGASVVSAGTMFSPTSDDEMDAEYPILSVSNDGRVTLNEYQRGEAIATRKHQRVQSNDIVYNPMRINIGSIGVVPRELGGGLVSPDYVVFRAEGLDPEFLVTLLRSPFYKMYIDVITTGSIRDRLYLRDLQTIRIPQCSPTAQAEACGVVKRGDAVSVKSQRQAKQAKKNAVELLHGLVRGRDDHLKPQADSESHPDSELFKDLADQWRRETKLLGSVSKKAIHPAYQRIIGLGQNAVPLILRDLSDNGPDDWFWALSSITGENPITASIAGKMNEMTEAWLQWGRQAGYLIVSSQATKRHSQTSAPADTA